MKIEEDTIGYKIFSQYQNPSFSHVTSCRGTEQFVISRFYRYISSCVLLHDSSCTLSQSFSEKIYIIFPLRRGSIVTMTNCTKCGKLLDKLLSIGATQQLAGLNNPGICRSEIRFLIFRWFTFTCGFTLRSNCKQSDRFIHTNNIDILTQIIETLTPIR